jgi:HAE1 family hydrophobic/amphiphilic exporter-1
VRIVRFSLARPITVIMAAVSCFLFGFVSLGRLPLNLLPDISYPTLTVQTEFPDAAPGEVENLVTRPLEEAVGVVSGVVSMSSSSRAGISEITLEFAWKKDMDLSALDVREKMDLVNLPDDSKDPVLLRFDPSLDPMIRVGIYGETDPATMRHYAEKVVKKELESLEGVASAKVSGGLEEEVQIRLDERKLALMGIPFSAVTSRLAEENVNLAGGRLRDSDAEYLVRTLGQYKDLEDIRETVLADSLGRRVLLGDVSTVRRGHKDRDVITRIRGGESVEVDVYKEGDKNTVEVARLVRRALSGLQRSAPKDVNIETLFDQSTFIEHAVSQVKSNALVGGLLAVLVLFLFLGDLRSTLTIAVSIPISVVATFMLMRLSNVTLNIMSLGGIALGVGMLVDNSIVVLESIHRGREQGKDRRTAALEGASQVGAAVTASTLTTVAVFLPIIFVEGVAGQVFRDQALTVTYSLLVSLVVALTLIPMIAASAPKREPTDPLAIESPGSRKERLGRLFWLRIPAAAIRALRRFAGRLSRIAKHGSDPATTAIQRGFDAFATSYAASLSWALRRPGLVIVSAAALFALATFSLRFVGMELIPPFSQGQFGFEIKLPEGTPLQATDDHIVSLETFLKNEPRVQTYFTVAGATQLAGSSLLSLNENQGQLNVRLRNVSDRAAEAAVIEELRDKFAESSKGIVKLKRPTYFSFRSPVEVDVFGHDLDETAKVAEQVRSRLSHIPGLKDVKTSAEQGSPELRIIFDKERLSTAGVGMAQAAAVLRGKLRGDVPTRFRDKERQLDIRVSAEDMDRADLDRISRLAIGTRGGVPIELGTVAQLVPGWSLGEIKRISQQRAVVVSANLTGRDLGSVTRDIRAALAMIPLPTGVTVSLGGQNEELDRSMGSMRLALALAVFLVYLVMACQFESLLHPLIMLFTVPLAVIGVAGALLLTSTPISVVVFLGAMMLAGIVVNNGIVLVDCINRFRADGMEKMVAIKEACRVRLRPILMTTVTTVLGLTPMALGLGEGAEIRTPMAITVIGGLMVSAALTLLVVPSLYLVLDRRR